MELQTGEFPGWDRSPVAFIRTRVVSQLATIATTNRYRGLYISLNAVAKINRFRYANS